MVAEFRSGSVKMFWKDDMMANEFKSGNFLQKMFLKTMNKRNVCFSKKSSEGITAENKKDIIGKLCPFMADNRKQFWESIPINNRN